MQFPNCSNMLAHTRDRETNSIIDQLDVGNKKLIREKGETSPPHPLPHKQETGLIGLVKVDKYRVKSERDKMSGFNLYGDARHYTDYRITRTGCAPNLRRKVKFDLSQQQLQKEEETGWGFVK